MTGGSATSSDAKARLVGAWLVGGACAWECVALVSDGRLPTWSTLAQRARRHPLGSAVIGGVLGVLAWHLVWDEG